jgi:hypothetical protein
MSQIIEKRAKESKRRRPKCAVEERDRSPDDNKAADAASDESNYDSSSGGGSSSESEEVDVDERPTRVNKRVTLSKADLQIEKGKKRQARLEDDVDLEAILQNIRRAKKKKHSDIFA